MGLFEIQQSLFRRRYACMKLNKDPNHDLVTYAGRVNRECAKFKIAECDGNQFKCLILVSGLQSSYDAFIRLKLLDKVETDPACSVQSSPEEYKRLTNLKQATKMVENGTPGSTKRHSPLKRNKESQSTHIRSGTRSLQPPPAPCDSLEKCISFDSVRIDDINAQTATKSDPVHRTDCTYNFNSKSAQGTFYVGRTQPNLLSPGWISKLGIYVASWIRSQMPILYSPPQSISNFGLHKYSQATLRLKDANPVFRPKRPMPYAAIPALEEEFDRVEAMDEWYDFKCQLF
ncbi:unnamed protein product [Haemonchus placei]|uniref:Retrovirus-related Pol polyprotein from transposon TNT 1-94 n=1 Tax=Haemonchus placei TaxID=6290 RepID=A0A0N4WPI0_HAEPC|nr:unnamed protein product [Haemonchus placei]